LFTPPSIFGIDRRIVYASRKYHSGWIHTGVISGFAGVKLSGSVKMYGCFRVNTVRVIIYLKPRNILYCKVRVEWDFVRVFV
jgi:hypothetical protein